MHKKALLMLFLNLASFNNQSYACKPAKEAYDLDAYLHAKRSGFSVFEAKVVKQTTTIGQNGLREQEVLLRIEKSLVGASKELVSVRAISGLMAGTSCEGSFDVEMRESELWFIVAETSGGSLHVRPMLSFKVVDAQRLKTSSDVINRYLREKSDDK